MKKEGFLELAEYSHYGEFKKKMNQLKKSYAEVQKQIKSLYKELDIKPINNDYAEKISMHLTVYLSELDIIEKKIKEISELINNIKGEILN